MDKTKALNDLRRFCWPITAHNRGYAQSLLASLGHSPQFPYPPFLSLWLPYTVATVLGEDASPWAKPLAKETERLEKIKANYDKEVTQTKAEIEAAQARRRAIMSASDEVNEALGKRLGY
jgi:hypothetical protein